MLNFADANIDFMGRRRLALALSAILILGSIFLLATRGLNFGIDFTGGTVIEVGYPEPVALEHVREKLEDGGYGRAIVQYFGTSQDVLIRLAPREGEDTAELSNEVFRVLQAGAETEVDLRRVEFVGPQVGEELREQGGLAMLYAMFGILVYVALRFEWRFSVGSVLALAHDVVITLGIFSLLQAEFDLSVLAAILAVIGYSLNDTIVVYDRIRENFRKMRKENAESVMNKAVNQMLSRTIITSGTTLLVLLTLYFLGGAVINNFALALIIGVLVGTYSSIYVAAALALATGVDRTVMLPVKKEGEDTQAVGEERP
ncbi:protein-export membrane protein SecF [Thioalkalivibrio denitrificans]|uniref:Protein-export membrane protein SecF n=1 Tax=Thioalkalivibrio denitrificans TaxID=108003 RepID=A0A1V3NB73_9GAMM|nr:protein translocase subunit SecF [Thioalkalivibrio denitrificans]OOG22281.1 protein-export membrane protein SecF [Thioalkalivibrio denitrificans]